MLLHTVFTYWKGVKVLSLGCAVFSVLLYQSSMLLHLLFWFLEGNAHAILTSLCKALRCVAAWSSLFHCSRKRVCLGYKNPTRQNKIERCLRLNENAHRSGVLARSFTHDREPNGNIKETVQKFTWHRGHRKVFQTAF